MGNPKKTDANLKPATPAMNYGVMGVNQAAAKAWLQVLSESTRFVTDRLQQDFETQMALLECKTPVELMKVQSEFLKTAMEQYADEAARLYTMMSRATEESISDAPFRQSRGYDDVPL